MSLDIPAEEFRRIAEQIASPDSPVGIDATKTHVLILDKLMKIEARLARLEELARRDAER